MAGGIRTPSGRKKKRSRKTPNTKPKAKRSRADQTKPKKYKAPPCNRRLFDDAAGETAESPETAPGVRTGASGRWAYGSGFSRWSGRRSEMTARSQAGTRRRGSPWMREFPRRSMVGELGDWSA